MADPLRIGIIGLGNIGRQHLAHIRSGEAGNCRVSATCARTIPAQAVAGAEHFTDYRQLIESGCCDAVIVATPTMDHAEIGIRALRNSLHVLMEKPLGLSVAEGELLLAAATGDRVFALMLNQRADPRFLAMKRCIAAGDIGEIQRTQWTMTNWFRPDVYFSVSDWRATWRGEGGGLLVNQCIHNLDIFQWLCGMPEQLHGFCAMGKHHPIEVEDEASAWLQYANGATGLFVGSTGEAPGINRLDIVGSHGTLCFDGERVYLHALHTPAPEFSTSTRDMFGMPGVSITDITPAETINQHAALIANFVSAVQSGEALIAPAADGLNSLSLANAILQSHWEQRPVNLPLNSADYQRCFQQHLELSKLREKSGAEVNIDMDQSYR